ncbi:hypothetical protein Tco_1549942, partial [Tanacetum coccineum]
WGTVAKVGNDGECGYEGENEIRGKEGWESTKNRSKDE